MVEIFPWDFYTRVGSCQELADCSQTDPVTGFGGSVLVQQIPTESPEKPELLETGSTDCLCE